MSLAIALFLVALADLIAGGIGGQPKSLHRTLVAISISALLGIAGLTFIDKQAAPTLVLLLVATLLFWSLGRYLGRNLNPILPLLALISGLASIFLVSAHAEPFQDVLWLRSLPYDGLNDLRLETLFLAGASLLFLSGSCNSIVRAVLQIAGTPVATSESRLRGGRIIGTIERWLIFGLALAGEPTAATLIASAKSILRFPELSNRSRDDDPMAVDELTEYFLVGSLTSWALALLSATVVYALA